MKKKTKISIWVYAAVVGLLIFFLYFNFSRPFENVAMMALNPISKIFYNAAAKVRIRYEKSRETKENLHAKIYSLEEERNRLINENVKYRMLEEENKNLREQLGFLSGSNYHYVTTNVISRGDLADSSKVPETIIIDKGFKDGIYNGLSVISGQGVIIGKIIDTKDEVAKINLSNNIKCKLAATILNDNKTNGIAEGDLGLTIKMSFIPQAIVIKKDDIVITSGLEESIPRGLIIGKVLEVQNESNELWQSAVIEPLFNPDDLIIVSVILP